MFNFSTSSSMSESWRGWREPLSLNSRCRGVVPPATIQAKMCWEVLFRGNGWDDCWVYECSLEIILHSVNSSEDEMIVGCMNVEFPRNYPPFSQLVWGWDDCGVYECWVTLKLSSIQLTRLRMGWFRWDDCGVYECWVTLKLSCIQLTRLRMGWLLGVWMLSSLWNYPPFSQLIRVWDDCWVYECWAPFEIILHSVN
jgi:hypothetical protein